MIKINFYSAGIFEIKLNICIMLTYEQLRENANDGDILFLTVNPRDVLSRLTAWWTNSCYTHAAFLFWYNGRLLVAESTTHGGSRIALASTYQTRTMALIPAPKSWNSIVDQALARSGSADYGWISAAYIGLREWALKNGIHLPQIRNNNCKACSEYVAEVLGLDDVDISPQKLFDTINN